MCGITGFVDFNNSTEKDVLVRMAGAIHHRGPDDAGVEFFRTSRSTVGFGFRRLAILDLSPAGHQPMHDSLTGNWIVFNGEIYNYQEIRAELEKNGDQFQSNSDTEVILASYRRWGKDCVHRFIGMFAICIFDATSEKLICFRDRAGVKPFFYYQANGLFLFASELKCFHQHPGFKTEIDTDALGYYFQHGCITAPYSIFRNTKKLSPGWLLELDLNTGEVSSQCYWDVQQVYNKSNQVSVTLKEAENQLDGLLRSAFNYRMIADVPVGVFLSGGYDSSCVAAILQAGSTSKIKTFTIGFEEEGYNEAPHARKVAEHLGTEHHEYFCTGKEAMEFIPKLSDVYDEPFGDSSAIPTLLVSRAARAYVTVALSADGGDELFAGYPRHRKSLSYINKLHVLPFRKFLSAFIPSGINYGKTDRTGKLKGVLHADSDAAIFDLINQTFTKAEIDGLLSSAPSALISPHVFKFNYRNSVSRLSEILALEYKTYLADDILQKVDRATMSVSLEGREPFLDQRIVEFAASLPDHWKMNAQGQKVILKNIVHRYIPSSIMERPKMGFGVPVSHWLKDDLKELFMEFMSDEAIRRNPYLNYRYVEELRKSYLENRLDNFERLWFVFVFQMWYDRWINKIS